MMNPTELLDPAVSAWLGDALLQSTLVLALALIANRLLVRRPAAWRHALLLAAAIAVPLVFVFSAILPAWKLPRSESLSGIFEARPVDTQHSIIIGAARAQPVGDDHAGSPAAQQASIGAGSQPAPGRSVGGILLLGWLLGVFAILVRLGLGILALGRIRATTGAPPWLLAVVVREARRCGLGSVPRIVFLGETVMPMTWRIRRHVIALPKSAAAWSAGRLRRVLRHEFAHIRRDDCRTSWLAEACLAVLWFHPFAWCVRREFDHACELASDDLALGRCPHGQERDHYAQDLLEIISKHAQHRRRSRGVGLALALAMADRCTGMRDRLDAILDPARDRRPVSRQARRWAVPVWLVGIAGIATLGACRTTQPESPKVEDGLAGEALTSHVAVQVRAVEVEDGEFLEKLFRAKREGSSFTGVVSAEDLETILAKLRARGSEVKSMPTIVTRYGKAGTTKQTREVIYPTRYDPPDVVAAEGGDQTDST
jgi:beta-lactamase regulating signal transducer with metallopeptidase domain